MRVHQLDEQGTIINTIIVPDTNFMPNLVDASLGGVVGDKIIDGEVVPQEPEVIPTSVPFQVSRRQARQALLIKGYLDAIPVVIDAIEDPVKRALAKIEWEDSLTFDRNRPLVNELGTAIGLSQSQLDDLFRFAVTL